MARILVLGDRLLDHYKFYKSIRNDPATPDVPVVKLVNEVKVDGGAGYLVRSLRELINIDVIYFHGSVPIKIRNYMDDKYTFREDINDEILHSPPLIDEFVDEIKDNDYVVISDYHKGTVEYSDIKRILNKCNKANITFIDTNHVQPEHEGVDWLKINYETARESVNIFGKNPLINLACEYVETTGISSDTKPPTVASDDSFVASSKLICASEPSKSSSLTISQYLLAS